MNLNSDRRGFLRQMMKCGCVVLAGTICPVSSYARQAKETPARFYIKLDQGSVQCQMCYRKCIIEDGKAGHCDIRINKKGILYTRSYGNPGALHIDPIEKKPFYHFRPGAAAFSIAEQGCNIDCKFCQNWQIAHGDPSSLPLKSLSPNALVQQASKFECPIIAYTYSEPTVWSEYVLDCAEAAEKMGIESVVVSNGSWGPAVLDKLLHQVHAIKVDLKSIETNYYRDICDASLKPVLDNILTIRKSNIWLELVNLVVTGLNDSDKQLQKLVRWVKCNLGTDVPIHFTRFHPMYLLKHVPATPVRRLDAAYQIAIAEGLQYVYVGNVPRHCAQNTVCPKCGTVLLERQGYHIKAYRLKMNKCEKCGATIPGIWN